MYFDFDALYNEARGDAFASGKKRYYDNRVKSVTTVLADGKNEIRATVSGDRQYSVRIAFDEQGGLYDYSCDCDGFSLESGPCKHIVAAALAYEERNPMARGGAVKTDAGALSLIAEYNDRRRRRMLGAGGAGVDMIPYLDVGADGAKLTFTLGSRKMYNLRDIPDFVARMRAASYKRYGVDLELYHVPESFTPGGWKIADFVIKSYLEKQKLGIVMHYKDELCLTGSEVDEFFALCEGGSVHIGRALAALVEPFDVQPSIKVKVSAEKDGFGVSLSRFGAAFIDGKDYVYLLDEGRIFRINEDFAASVRPLFDTIALKKKLFVAEQDMSAFYNSVLARVSGYLDLESDSDISGYEAAPLVCKIYVNGEDGKLSIDVRATYDDQAVDIIGDYRGGDFVRDWDSENAIRGVLAKYFPAYPALWTEDEETIFDFLTDGVKELMGYAEVYVTESMKKMRVLRPPRIRVGVRLESNLLDLDLAADGFTYEELIEILEAYRAKKRYVRLVGGFVSLADSSIQALGDILDVASVTDKGLSLPRYYAPYVNAELTAGFFTLARDSAFKGLVKSLESVENSDIAVPPTLAAVMRNYQKTGYRWLRMLAENGFGGILADDMGLGKSLQVIALLLETNASALIVCPTTLMLNWLGEIAKFAPSLSALAVMGSQDERRALIAECKNYSVVITSYDLIRRDIDLYEEIKFDYAIADEAQFIKNPETRNAVAVKRIDASYRFALTGTPIENNLSELWSIFDFIMPGYLGSYSAFRDKYEVGVVRGDENSAERMRRVVKPFILRRLKADVLKELPPKTETVIAAPLEGEQRKMYDAALAVLRESVRGEELPGRVVVLSMLTRLRQICCDPLLVEPSYAGNSAKTDACLELIETAAEGGHKVLLFSQFTSMLDIIEKRLTLAGISHYLLKGDTPKAERLRLIDRFNENDVKVFLISLKAGGTGVNLTGADVVIHYDPWWNESVMNQATDRAYRMGQTHSVQVYKLVMGGSLEEKIMELQERKRALSSSIVGKENGIKEILELLA